MLKNITSYPRLQLPANARNVSIPFAQYYHPAPPGATRRYFLKLVGEEATTPSYRAVYSGLQLDTRSGSLVGTPNDFDLSNRVYVFVVCVEEGGVSTGACAELLVLFNTTSSTSAGADTVPLSGAGPLFPSTSLALVVGGLVLFCRGELGC